MTMNTPNEPATNAPAPPTPEATLQDLAKHIKVQHTKFQNSLRASLGFARSAGDALKKAKEIVKDNGGSWGRWCKKHCNLKDRQAQKYMQIAAGYAELVGRGHDPDKLTINQAVRLLAALRDNQPAPGNAPVAAPPDGEPAPGHDPVAAAAPAEAERPQSPYRLSQGELRQDAGGRSGSWPPSRSASRRIRRRAGLCGTRSGCWSSRSASRRQSFAPYKARKPWYSRSTWPSP